MGNVFDHFVYFGWLRRYLPEARPRRRHHSQGKAHLVRSGIAKSGQPDSPDYIPKPAEGEVYDVPNEKIILRYLNSISEKYERQYAKWGAADGEAQPSKVTTGVFQDKQHEGLSGLLCSRVEAANRRGEIGQDFQLAPNPHANVPLPESFRLGGTYYAAEIVGSGYKVTRTASNKQAVII